MTGRDGAGPDAVGQLAEIVAQVGAARDLESALRALVVGAMRLVAGTSGAVRAYDVDGAGRHLAYWATVDGTLQQDPHPEPPAGSVTAALKAGHDARIIPDLWDLAPEASEAQRRARWRGARSSVAVPISARGERIGSLHVDHTAVGHFGASELSLVATLAAHAGLVVERAREAARQQGERAAHESVRLSERRFRAFMEQSPLATQVFAPNGDVLLANAAWETLFGVGRAALAGYNLRRDPQLAAKGAAALIERAFGGEPVEIPPLLYDPAEIGKPGRPRWLRARCYPLRDESGALVEVVLILEDVTSARESEARQSHLYAAAAALSAQAAPEEVAREVATHARAALGATEAAVVALVDDGRWFEVLAQATSPRRRSIAPASTPTPESRPASTSR